MKSEKLSCLVKLKPCFTPEKSCIPIAGQHKKKIKIFRDHINRYAKTKCLFTQARHHGGHEATRTLVRVAVLHFKQLFFPTRLVIAIENVQKHVKGKQSLKHLAVKTCQLWLWMQKMTSRAWEMCLWVRDTPAYRKVEIANRATMLTMAGTLLTRVFVNSIRPGTKGMMRKGLKSRKGLPISARVAVVACPGYNDMRDPKTIKASKGPQKLPPQVLQRPIMSSL